MVTGTVEAVTGTAAINQLTHTAKESENVSEPRDVREIKAKETPAPELWGPLYTGPGKNLGPEKVGGPKGGKTSPDPIGLKHASFKATGKGGGGDKGGKKGGSY